MVLPGEIAGLLAACMWASSSILFTQVRVSAAGLNLFKNSLGALLLIVTLLVLNGRLGEWPLHPSRTAWGFLAASALVGLVIGDTCYFRSMQILGPRRSLVLTTLAPPAALLLGWLMLGERHAPLALLGIALSVFGVLWVVRERGHEIESAGHFPGSLAAGLAYGAAGSLCQALGGVWSKEGIGLLKTLDGVTQPALEASFVRLGVATVIGLAFGASARRLGAWRTQVCMPGVAKRLLPASFLGTYLGIWFSLMAYERTSVGVATTLTSMSPVFVLPLVVIFLGQRVSPRAIIGVCLALCGVGLLFWAR